MEVKLTILIKEQHVKSGISMRRLGATSEISKNYIPELERGLSIPSILVQYRLAKAMDVLMTNLFWYK